MYDSFSSDYDRFVDWPARLKVELPFLEGQLRASGAHRVLDAACGTGQHAIALARIGFDAAGADLSANMVARAKGNALAADMPVDFKQAGFGELTRAFGEHSFDALICLGNSLPHVLTHSALVATLQDFRECIRPGGLLIVQNRNFDSVLASRQRWMEPQAHREGQEEWLFMRFYDYEADGLLTFHVVTLHRAAGGAWGQSAVSTHLRPMTQAELARALAEAEFSVPTLFGDMSGAPFEPAASGNLVVIGRAPPTEARGPAGP
jgi:glycine/sarcosine N-methyltransferase